jgi:hypothetical protein
MFSKFFLYVLMTFFLKVEVFAVKSDEVLECGIISDMNEDNFGTPLVFGGYEISENEHPWYKVH